MVVYQTSSKLPWNLENIRFLYPPDDFVGGFTNPKMQERHKAMQEEKVNSIINGLIAEPDPAKAMRILHARDYIQFLRNNREKFKKAGRYEDTVLKLFMKENTPFSAVGDFEIWYDLFNDCDQQQMRALGQPFPYQRATGFRGSVVGVKQGFLWTLSRTKTAWFIDRWRDKSMGGGTLFSLEIEAADIIIYRKTNEVEEVILRPDLVTRCEPQIINELP